MPTILTTLKLINNLFRSYRFTTSSQNGLQRTHLLVPDQHARKRRSIRRPGQFGNVYDDIMSPRRFVKSYIYEDACLALMVVKKL
jgi:hypothetical protein